MVCRPITFWRYNLILETVSLLLVCIVLFLALYFTLERLNRAYLDLPEVTQLVDRIMVQTNTI